MTISWAPTHFPLALPTKPTGFTKTLVVHFNFGRNKGSAAYKVLDPLGNETPISYHYCDGGKSSWFQLAREETEYSSWGALVDAWPEYRRRQLRVVP